MMEITNCELRITNYVGSLKILFLVVTLFSILPTFAQYTIPEIPKLQTSVYDYANLLSTSEKKQLEDMSKGEFKTAKRWVVEDGKEILENAKNLFSEADVIVDLVIADEAHYLKNAKQNRHTIKPML